MAGWTGWYFVHFKGFCWLNMSWVSNTILPLKFGLLVHCRFGEGWSSSYPSVLEITHYLWFSQEKIKNIKILCETVSDEQHVFLEASLSIFCLYFSLHTSQPLACIGVQWAYCLNVLSQWSSHINVHVSDFALYFLDSFLQKPN